MRSSDQRRGTFYTNEDHRVPTAAPGKQTHTQALPPMPSNAGGESTTSFAPRAPQRSVGEGLDVQRAGDWDAGELMSAMGLEPTASAPTSKPQPVQLRNGSGSGDAEHVHTAAAHGIAGAGSPLPFLDQIQASFGADHDLSQVQAHVGGPAAEGSAAMGAQAYATGNHVAFATAPDLHTAAHEAAHVVQQRAGVRLKGGVGESGDSYEQHADAVADKVVKGESASELLGAKAGGSSVSRKTVQRFDAGSGGHQGLERHLAGLDPHDGLGQPDNLKKREPARNTREFGANAIYAGNYMQDFSQMHAPFVHNLLTNLPKRPAEGRKSPPIGHAGSEAITDSIVRALAILEVGPTLADSVVKGNMQAYRPEQHVDQPQGYAANTDAIVHHKGPKGALRPGKRTVEGGDYVATSKFAPGKSTPVKRIADPDRDRDLAGSAVPGRQMENPELFKVSDAGLQNHIYNSCEWVKNHWMKAAQVGPTDQGRFHIGAGLHAIEDYFSHSNFIEVALNSYIDSSFRNERSKPAGVQQFLHQVDKNEKALGGVRRPQQLGGMRTHVDTLFDATVGRGRQVVTTGSVSGVDMKGSIGHILLPKAPALQKAIDESLEKIFGLVIDSPDKVSSWNKMKAISKADRPMAAVMALGEGCDSAGMTLPVPTGVSLTWTTREIPLPFMENPEFRHPSGVTLDMESRSITSATSSYVSFCKDAKETLETIQKYVGYAKHFGPLGDAAVQMMEQLLELIHGWMRDQIKSVRDRIKQQLMLGMVALIDSIAGVDSRDDANRTIGDALADIHDHVEIFETQTSLEARLLPGGDLAELSDSELEPIVGPVKPAPGGGWIALHPLAPSHSEISKDHAAYQDFRSHGKGTPMGDTLDHHEGHGELLHPELHQEGVKHEHAEGSIFGGLARALASEADLHVLRQVEIMWKDRGTLYGDEGSLDTSKMAVGHGAFNQEASGRATAEEKRAGKTGYQHAQSDADNADVMSRPGVRALLDLVDLIIAHPNDTTWWRTVAETYINAHPDEVARHIRERNATRGNRSKVTP